MFPTVADVCTSSTYLDRSIGSQLAEQGVARRRQRSSQGELGAPALFSGPVYPAVTAGVAKYKRTKLNSIEASFCVHDILFCLFISDPDLNRSGATPHPQSNSRRH